MSFERKLGVRLSWIRIIPSNSERTRVDIASLYSQSEGNSRHGIHLRAEGRETETSHVSGQKVVKGRSPPRRTPVDVALGPRSLHFPSSGACVGSVRVRIRTPVSDVSTYSPTRFTTARDHSSMPREKPSA